MASRLDFHTFLLALLGSNNVYFQPPESIRLSYPCIIYHRRKIDTSHADNKPYLLKDAYRVVLIESDPDSPLPKQVASVETAFHEQFFTKDGLNHNVFSIYF